MRKLLDAELVSVFPDLSWNMADAVTEVNGRESKVSCPSELYIIIVENESAIFASTLITLSSLSDILSPRRFSSGSRCLAPNFSRLATDQ